MNEKLKVVVDAINNLEIGELTDEELSEYRNLVYDEYLDAQRLLYRRGK